MTVSGWCRSAEGLVDIGRYPELPVRRRIEVEVQVRAVYIEGIVDVIAGSGPGVAVILRRTEAGVGVHFVARVHQGADVKAIAEVSQVIVPRGLDLRHPLLQIDVFLD